MNDEEFPSRKVLKMKSRKRDQIIQTFSKICSTSKLGPPSFFLEITTLWEKISWIMQSALESNEWRRTWV